MNLFRTSFFVHELKDSELIFPIVSTLLIPEW